MSTTPAIRIQGLVKRHGSRAALDGLAGTALVAARARGRAPCRRGA